MHTSEYRSTSQLPEGNVLVIGCAQSGSQIAELLAKKGVTISGKMENAERYNLCIKHYITQFKRTQHYIYHLDNWL